VPSVASESSFDPVPKRRWVDRGKAEKLWLNRLELRPRILRVHQAAGEHLSHILKILIMTALDLGQCLGDWIEMVKGDLALPPDQRASVLPSCGKWDEIRRCGELYVDVELLLQPGYLAQDLIAVGNRLDVDIDGALSPAVENSGCAPVK
jgi:hypothetical protein